MTKRSRETIDHFNCCSLYLTQPLNTSFRMLGPRLLSLCLFNGLGRLQHFVPDADEAAALCRHPRSQSPHVCETKEDLGAPEGAQGEIVYQVQRTAVIVQKFTFTLIHNHCKDLRLNH